MNYWLSVCFLLLLNMVFSQDVITKLSINDFDRNYSIVLQSNDSATMIMNPCHLSPKYKEIWVDSFLLEDIKDLFAFKNRVLECMMHDPDSIFINGGNIWELANVQRDSIQENKVRLYFINTREKVLYYKVMSKKRFYRKLKRLLKKNEELTLYKEIISGYRRNELDSYF